MTALAPWGLYPSRACVAAQRLQADQALALDTPVPAAGATVFRKSLWLALPATVRGCTQLVLDGSALRFRFAPTTLQVATDNTAWFNRVNTDADNRTARLQFTWPASVTRLANPSGYQGEGFKLYRVDGDRVADEATQSGATGAVLNPPWVGSPLQVVMDRALPPLSDLFTASALFDVGTAVAAVKAAPAVRAAPAGAGSSPIGEIGEIVNVGQAHVLQHPRSHLVPSVSISGVPTSPRLKLFAEARGTQPETLLWQALLPGEQGTVNLPEGAVADEWAPALEQLRQRLADETPPLPTPVLLRLDIESDTPCAVTLMQAMLSLAADHELLTGETRLDFDGTRAQTLPLALAWPPGTPQVPLSLVLSGRIGGGTNAPASSGPGAMANTRRQGLLLAASQRARVEATLTAPTRLAGVAVLWHPLSSEVRVTLRLLPESGASPLAEQACVLATPAPAWLALRLPPLDLQAGRVWLELAVDEGSGLWLAADDTAAVLPGFTENIGDTPGTRQPLGLTPAFAWLPPDTAADAARGVAVLCGSQVLAPTLAAQFQLTCPGALLAALPGQGLQLHSASTARVSVQSVRARWPVA